MRAAAEEQVRAGDVAGALASLQSAVRDKPADAALRVFLFQLYCITGDWSRAMVQLNVAGELDAANLLMTQTYRELLRCEIYREAVFRGDQSPLVFGEPAAWVAKQMQALAPAANGDGAAAAALSASAVEAAPARSGSVDDQAVAWLCDADPRLGPVIEAVVDGKYYWIPAERIAELTLSEPEDLRDLVWLPAHFRWTNDGTRIGFVPARYPGPESLADPACALGRKTDWVDLGGDYQVGRGQKMWASDVDDHPILATRKIRFEGTA